MKYRIIVAPDAQRDLREVYRFFKRDAPLPTRNWIRGARKAIRALSRSPERCPLAPESVSFGKPIRELFYGSENRGSYRILFVVLDSTVCVLHVRHGSRDIAW
jgi:plasmid stabilization system protein ParE